MRLIITNIPTHKEKKLKLLSALSLASPRLTSREAFSVGHGEEEGLGASSLPCIGARGDSREETKKEPRRKAPWRIHAAGPA